MTISAPQAQFSGIYRSFWPLLYRYFHSCFGPDEAEDLCQQTFLGVWAYLLDHPDFEPRDWRAWLFRAAVNKKNDRIRYIKSLPRSFSLEEERDSLPAELILPDFCGPQTDRLALKAALLDLKEQERNILLLKGMGFSSGEMGKILGLSASTVRSRLVSARQHFAQKLEAASLPL